MASLFESIEKGLDTWGFDLCQPFAIEDYNDNVSDIYKIPSMGRENTLAILVGNSRNIWVPFITKLANDEELFKNENPLDTYTKMAVESVLSKIHIPHKVYYCSDGQQLPFLNYQLIAEISGMCKRSYKSKMCYHWMYGHWIGLRAVIVFDHSFVYNLSTKHMQDFEICKCDDVYGREIEKLAQNKHYIWQYRGPTIWRSWLALRTICTHNHYNYSYEQACYHYSKNRKILEREVERYRNNCFEQKYDWLEEFNADPEHYRIDDDDKLNICYKQIKMNEFHFLLLVILCISDDTFLLHKLPKFQLQQSQVIQRIIQKEIHVLYKLFSKTLDSHFELIELYILANL